MTFGSWLKSYLLEHGIQQKDFANLIDFSEKTVSAWICDRHVPNGFTFVLITNTLSILLKKNRPVILESMANSICRKNLGYCTL